MRMTGKVFVPPLKIQGIKTKIVPLIRQNAAVEDGMLWIEPFMGSGVVGFNLEPWRAVFADLNPHIVNFYNAVKSGSVTSSLARLFLEEQGHLLAVGDEDYYYQVRERFNSTHEPLDFLFLNRACFNGMMRFNKKYEFNVPYGHKPQRFTNAYITKIVNQIGYVEKCLKRYDWTFVCQPFEKTISLAPENSFIYCDPPYIGRHVDYYDSWDDVTEIRLCQSLQASHSKFMLSTWDYNRYRQNEYIDKVWGFCRKVNKEHFYYLGAKEINRAPVVEALLMNYQPQEIKQSPEMLFPFPDEAPKLQTPR